MTRWTIDEPENRTSYRQRTIRFDGVVVGYLHDDPVQGKRVTVMAEETLPLVQTAVDEILAEEKRLHRLWQQRFFAECDAQRRAEADQARAALQQELAGLDSTSDKDSQKGSRTMTAELDAELTAAKLYLVADTLVRRAKEARDLADSLERQADEIRRHASQVQEDPF
jgi:hypothetical protein